MKKLFLVLLAAVLAFSSCSNDDEKVLGDKEGILLVTFGSSYPEPQKTFANMEAQFKNEFPSTEIRWAYTSHIIRNILLKKGMDIDSPEEALKKMVKDGYSTINIQSLHVIPGAEYTDLLGIIEEFKADNAGVSVKVGKPLMNSDEDMNELADSLITAFNSEKEAGELVVFMGHGTHHAANDRYGRLQTIISAKTDNFFVGTVEGTPELSDVVALMDETGIKTVTLTPLMSIAGDHANNDMAGDEEESWKTILEAKGYTVKTVLKGLGDYNGINSIWVNHLKEVK